VPRALGAATAAGKAEEASTSSSSSSSPTSATPGGGPQRFDFGRGLDRPQLVEFFLERQPLPLCPTTGAQVIVLAGSREQPVSEEQARPAIEQFLLNERRRKLVEDEIKALRSAATLSYVGKFAEAAASAPASAGAEPCCAGRVQPTPNLLPECIRDGMGIAWVFPGQGSQKLGIAAAVLDLPEAPERFAQASALLGRDLLAICAGEAPA
jgi:hypothetical protein